MLSIMTFLTSLAFAGDWTNNKGLTNHGAVYNSFESSSVGLTLFITAFCFDDFDDSMSVLITVMLGHPLHQYKVERPKRSSALGDNLQVYAVEGNAVTRIEDWIVKSTEMGSLFLEKTRGMTNEIGEDNLNGSEIVTLFSAESIYVTINNKDRYNIDLTGGDQALNSLISSCRSKREAPMNINSSNGL